MWEETEMQGLLSYIKIWSLDSKNHMKPFKFVKQQSCIIIFGFGIVWKMDDKIW